MPWRPQSTGDGAPATLGRIGTNGMRGISRDLDGGGFLVADGTNNVVRLVSSEGTLSTVAGTGLGFSTNAGANGPGTSARLRNPSMVLPESAVSILILDRYEACPA